MAILLEMTVYAALIRSRALVGSQRYIPQGAAELNVFQKFSDVDIAGFVPQTYVAGNIPLFSAVSPHLFIARHILGIKVAEGQVHDCMGDGIGPFLGRQQEIFVQKYPAKPAAGILP